MRMGELMRARKLNDLVLRIIQVIVIPKY